MMSFVVRKLVILLIGWLRVHYSIPTVESFPGRSRYCRVYKAAEIYQREKKKSARVKKKTSYNWTLCAKKGKESILVWFFICI